MTVPVERAMSTSPFSGRAVYEDESHHNGSRLPPWEQRNRTNVVQVPFMSPSTPPLTHSEHQALSSLWASKMSAKESRDRSMSSDRIPAAPLTAPSPPTFHSPYESVRIPQGPKTAPHVPSFVKAPPTPPEIPNFSRSSSKSSQNPNSHETSPSPGACTPAVPALPGTMYTREFERDRSCSRSRSAADNLDKVEPQGFGKRFRTSFKNMFKRDPIDESQFEHIGDRHWTEE